jgi:hypothetical protein
MPNQRHESGLGDRSQLARRTDSPAPPFGFATRTREPLIELSRHPHEALWGAAAHRMRTATAADLPFGHLANEPHARLLPHRCQRLWLAVQRQLTQQVAMTDAESKPRPLWRRVGSSQSVCPAVDLKRLLAGRADDRVQLPWGAAVPDVQQPTPQPHRLPVVSPLPAQRDVASGAQTRVFFRRPDDPAQRSGHA